MIFSPGIGDIVECSRFGGSTYVGHIADMEFDSNLIPTMVAFRHWDDSFFKMNQIIRIIESAKQPFDIQFPRPKFNDNQEVTLMCSDEELALVKILGVHTYYINEENSWINYKIKTDKKFLGDIIEEFDIEARLRSKT